MRTFDPDTLASLASGRIATRTLLLFDFPSGQWGFWDGVGILAYAGVDYVGIGKLLGADAVTLSGALDGAPLTLTLSSIPDTDLSPDMLASIEAEQYHQRPVTMSEAYFDPASRALLSVERLYRGYVDQITHETTAGGQALLICRAESRSRDVTRAGHRSRTDADQRRIDPDDGALRHAAEAGEVDILWGKWPSKAKS